MRFPYPQQGKVNKATFETEKKKNTMKIKIKIEQNSSSQTWVVSIQHTGGGDVGKGLSLPQTSVRKRDVAGSQKLRPNIKSIHRSLLR